MKLNNTMAKEIGYIKLKIFLWDDKVRKRPCNWIRPVLAFHSEIVWNCQREKAKISTFRLKSPLSAIWGCSFVRRNACASRAWLILGAHMYKRRPCQPTKGLRSTWKIAHSGAHGPCHFFKCSPSLSCSFRAAGWTRRQRRQRNSSPRKQGFQRPFILLLLWSRESESASWAPLLNKNARNFDTKSCPERDVTKGYKQNISYIFILNGLNKRDIYFKTSKIQVKIIWHVSPSLKSNRKITCHYKYKK